MKPQRTNWLINIFDNVHKPFVERGSSIGIKANHITFLQLPFVIAMFYFLINNSLNAAIIALFISLYLDLLDGSWARLARETSRVGHILDKIIDLVGIVAFLAALFMIKPELSFLVLSLSIANFLVYASNIFVEPELYCGARSFGLLGLIFFSYIEIFILIPLIICIGILIYKLVVNYAKR